MTTVKFTGTVGPDKRTRYERVVDASTEVCTLCKGDIVRQRDEYWISHPEGEDGEPTNQDPPQCVRCSSTGMTRPNLLRCPACGGTGNAPDGPDGACGGCGGSGVALLNLTNQMREKIVHGLRDLATRIEGGGCVLRSLLVVDEAKVQQEGSHWVLIEWAGKSMFPAPPTQRRYELAERLGDQMFVLAAKLGKEVA